MQGERVIHSKNCRHCGIEYKAGVASSRFCSARCRAASWRSGQDVVEPVQKEMPEFKPHAAESSYQDVNSDLNFLVNLLNERCDQWEERYLNECRTSEDWQQKYIRARGELKEQKFKQQLVEKKLEMLNNERSTGLNGLAQNPLVLKFVEHAGPALTGLVSRIVDNRKGQNTKPGNTRLSDDSLHYIQLPAVLPEDRKLRMIEIIRYMTTLELHDLDAAIQSVTTSLGIRRTDPGL